MSRRMASRKRQSKRLLRLVGVVSAGILALPIVSPVSRATDPAPDREERHENARSDPLTVEALTREAEEIVARVLEAYPRDANAHALMGKMRYLHGNTKEAEKSWERCLELDPDRADIYETLAKATWEKGEFERTAAACRQALRIDPTMPGVQIRLGRSLLELGQIEEAIAVMEQAVSRSGSGHYYLAQAYMQSKAYEKARDSFQRAVEKHPDNAQAYYGLALASIRLGQPEKARQYQEAFRKYGVEDPESIKAEKRRPKQLSGLARERSTTAIAYVGAADIHRHHGNLQQAERLWQKAALIDPNDSASRDELLALYEHSGRLEDARTFFEQLTQAQPKNALDHFHLGNLCTRLNRRDEAEQAYLAVTRLAPDRPEGYEALVQLYLTTGWKLPTAKASASRAVQLRPTPRNYFLLAQVCTKIGDRADALTALEQALKLDPDNVPCRRLYGELRKAG
ncbi:MAG: tetratricopeptide repeat protein [bacterium]|nr:tetratricopeptide repeat protein [bacterium]